jgi:calcium-dependent protein kinase
MEYCQGGSLLERLNSLLENNKTFTTDQSAFILRQIMLGLHYAHSNNIVHRDIKLENIMFNDKNITNLNLKIIDFGLSKFYHDGINKMEEKLGTCMYMSPEILNGNYTEKCDIWACGVLLYLLLIGIPPFFSEVEGDNEIIYKKISKIDFQFNNKCK